MIIVIIIIIINIIVIIIIIWVQQFAKTRAIYVLSVLSMCSALQGLTADISNEKLNFSLGHALLPGGVVFINESAKRWWGWVFSRRVGKQDVVKCRR